jgi:hypothetical protein
MVTAVIVIAATVVPAMIIAMVVASAVPAMIVTMVVASAVPAMIVTSIPVIAAIMAAVIAMIRPMLLMAAIIVISVVKGRWENRPGHGCRASDKTDQQRSECRAFHDGLLMGPGPEPMLL